MSGSVLGRRVVSGRAGEFAELEILGLWPFGRSTTDVAGSANRLDIERARVIAMVVLACYATAIGAGVLTCAEVRQQPRSFRTVDCLNRSRRPIGFRVGRRVPIRVARPACCPRLGRSSSAMLRDGICMLLAIAVHAIPVLIATIPATAKGFVLSHASLEVQTHGYAAFPAEGGVPSGGPNTSGRWYRNSFGMPRRFQFCTRCTPPSAGLNPSLRATSAAPPRASIRSASGWVASMAAITRHV